MSVKRAMIKGPRRLDESELGTVRDALLRPKEPRGFSAFVAADADLDELAAASLAAFGEDNALRRADFRFYLHKGHSLIFGLKKQGAIAAYCVLELNAGQARIYVVETHTAPELRGQGLGSWLRGRVDDVARHLGYRHIASHVAVTNTPALKLNEKANMVVLRRIDEYYADGRDAYYLRKTLEDV